MTEPTPENLINVEDAGHWEGDTLHFNEPLVSIGDGVMVAKGITIPPDALEDGITRDDVISALLNPIVPFTSDPPDGDPS